MITMLMTATTGLPWNDLILYSKHQEEFVQNLRDRLENDTESQPTYKYVPTSASAPSSYEQCCQFSISRCCIHDRDWRVGEFIPFQIVDSVNKSRRTLIVLSPEYFAHEWTMMEFNCAHKRWNNSEEPLSCKPLLLLCRSRINKRQRLIVVLPPNTVSWTQQWGRLTGVNVWICFDSVFDCGPPLK